MRLSENVICTDCRHLQTLFSEKQILYCIHLVQTPKYWSCQVPEKTQGEKKKQQQPFLCFYCFYCTQAAMKDQTGK